MLDALTDIQNAVQTNTDAALEMKLDTIKNIEPVKDQKTAIQGT